MKTNKFHIHDAHKIIGTHRNLPFWISMIEASQRVTNANKSKKVLDFGCGDGKFLHIFDIMDNLHRGIGVENDEKLLEEAKKITNSKISFEQKLDCPKYENYFDIVYSQEVLYTLPNIEEHAKLIYDCLDVGGYYFATMGCHIENPLWPLRRAIIKKEEAYPVCDYSLDQIAEIFYNIGFEVGLKRLPVEYFAIYHPEITTGFSKSYTDLVKTLYENKMLFMFFKDN